MPEKPIYENLKQRVEELEKRLLSASRQRKRCGRE